MRPEVSAGPIAAQLEAGEGLLAVLVDFSDLSALSDFSWLGCGHGDRDSGGKRKGQRRRCSSSGNPKGKLGSGCCYERLAVTSRWHVAERPRGYRCLRGPSLRAGRLPLRLSGSQGPNRRTQHGIHCLGRVEHFGDVLIEIDRTVPFERQLPTDEAVALHALKEIRPVLGLDRRPQGKFASS